MGILFWVALDFVGQGGALLWLCLQRRGLGRCGDFIPNFLSNAHVLRQDSGALVSPAGWRLCASGIGPAPSGAAAQIVPPRSARLPLAKSWIFLPGSIGIGTWPCAPLRPGISLLRLAALDGRSPPGFQSLGLEASAGCADGFSGGAFLCSYYNCGGVR